MFEETCDGVESYDTDRVVRLRINVYIAIKKDKQQQDEGGGEGRVIEVVEIKFVEDSGTRRFSEALIYS